VLENGTQSGAGLALGGIIVGFAEIVTVVLLIVALVAVVKTDGQELQIAGAPGYNTFSGPTGKPMAEGRPWGVVCQPIVFRTGAGVPDSVYTQLERVVQTARAGGVDVTVATRQDRWYPDSLYPSGLTDRSVQFVSVFASTQTPPVLDNGKSEHVAFQWNARSSDDGNHEIVTYLQVELYLKTLTGPAVVRRAARQLVAFSQGVGGSSAAGSGIADGSIVDSFSSKDLSAMELMSGCRSRPT
jgi:hypothetical protein